MFPKIVLKFFHTENQSRNLHETTSFIERGHRDSYSLGGVGKFSEKEILIWLFICSFFISSTSHYVYVFLWTHGHIYNNFWSPCLLICQFCCLFRSGFVGIDWFFFFFFLIIGPNFLLFLYSSFLLDSRNRECLLLSTGVCLSSSVLDFILAGR